LSQEWLGWLEDAVHRVTWKSSYMASMGPCPGTRGVLSLILGRGGLYFGSKDPNQATNAELLNPPACAFEI